MPTNHRPNFLPDDEYGVAGYIWDPMTEKWYGSWIKLTKQILENDEGRDEIIGQAKRMMHEYLVQMLVRVIRDLPKDHMYFSITDRFCRHDADALVSSGAEYDVKVPDVPR